MALYNRVTLVIAGCAADELTPEHADVILTVLRHLDLAPSGVVVSARECKETQSCEITLGGHAFERFPQWHPGMNPLRVYIDAETERLWWETFPKGD